MRYQIRYAAGVYWVLDMRQNGKEPVRPVMLNESGAGLLRMLLNNQPREALVEYLCQLYELDRQQAKQDVADFVEQMRKEGIVLPEEKEDNKNES